MAADTLAKRPTNWARRVWSWLHGRCDAALVVPGDAVQVARFVDCELGNEHAGQHAGFDSVRGMRVYWERTP